MAIQMNEWGMMREPDSATRIPLQGLFGWEESGRAVGAGLSSVLVGLAELAKARERVSATGELAAFSERLHAIGDEVRDELEDCEVQDWEYAWREASSPRLAEAVAELPPASRQAGRELAEAFNAKASLMALRDHEVGKINRSRELWQRQVDSAVEAGDEELAKECLQSGAGVFVPEAEMEGTLRLAGSRARAARWRRELSQAPLQALGDFAAAGADSLPEDAEVAGRLEEEMRRAGSDQRVALSAKLSGQVRAGQAFDKAELEAARRAKLLTESQYGNACAEAARPAGAGEWCAWQRRIDECAEDAAAVAGLQLDIATAAMPGDDRKRLLGRLEMACRVPRADREALSRRLWEMYRRGGFGCPGDALALQRLADVQRDGLPVLAEQGAEASALWVEALGSESGRWVRFSSINNETVV